MEKKIFLSVGKASTPQQEDFVKCIERHLEANGLVPRTVGRSAFSSGQPLKLVENLMEECCGTVIVAFERTYIETGLDRRGNPEQKAISARTLPTVWNQIEAAMAYVHGHPLLVIVEHGLKSEGLLETNYDWYVQWCQLDQSVLAKPEFAGVFADWKLRVEERGSRPKQPRVSPDKLTLGEVFKAMTVPQWWAILTGIAVALAGVAVVAFRLGQHAGLGK